MNQPAKLVQKYFLILQNLKKITNKKWSLILILIVFLTFIINTTFLYIIDTYNVINPTSKKYYTIPNQRFMLIEYILKNHKLYDTYIMGSSRVSYLNPLNLKNKKAYNMTCGEGIPHEELLILKLLLKNNIKIKHLLIGLDEFSYMVPFSKHDSQFGSKSHYLATANSFFDFFKFYFFRLPNKTDFKHFYNKYIIQQSIDIANPMYGKIRPVIYDQKNFYLNKTLLNNHNEKYKKDSKFLMPTIYEGNTLNKTISDIKAIIQLCEENNILFKFYINPIHHTTYNFTNKNLLNQFRRELSKLTSYYDFSHPSPISNNNGYWEDTSHFNYEIGDAILQKIYNDSSRFGHFGIYIPKNSITN